MQAFPEVVFEGVKDAVHRARAIAMRGEANDVDGNPPLLVVKNTFLEVRDPLALSVGPKSLSCPIAAFIEDCGDTYGDIESFPQTLTGSSDIGLSDLSAAARVFSTGEVSREVMEAAGHVMTRRSSDPAVVIGPMQEPVCKTKMVPPALLCEPEGPPETTQYVDSIPEAPHWSPKVSPERGMMQNRPAPPALQTAITGAMTWAPLQHPVPPFATVQTQPLAMSHHLVNSNGTPVFSTPVRSEALFRVAYRGGVALRQGPYYEGVRTGDKLHHNEIFSVSGEIQGSDGRLYLRLADGRGWAFDDSALMPHDPSVVRGCWAPLSSASTPSTHASTPSSSVWQPMEEPMTTLAEPAGQEQETKKKRRRRKRGGVKRRPKNKVAEEDPEAEADTDAPHSETEMVGSESPQSEAEDISADVHSEIEAGARHNRVVF